MRGKIIPVLGIAIIILCAIYILGQPSEKVNPTTVTVEEPVVQERKVRVYLLREDKELGSDITRKDVSINWISEPVAEANAITAELKIDFTKKVLARTNLHEGDILFPESLVTNSDEDYLDFIILPDHIPYPFEVDSNSVVGGVIRESSKIDILALSSNSENLASQEQLSSRSFTGVALTPVLININVLKIETATPDTNTVKRQSLGQEVNKSALILELTPKQVATLTVAKKIAQLVVHKSLGIQSRKELSADAGDILENYKAIKEFRAEEARIN